MKRDGFTLLEVLVASVLMGMLVTILTVIFNQSAIAWRTGKAGVADMSEIERKLSYVHSAADNVLPYTGDKNYYLVSPWNDTERDGEREFHQRGIADAGTAGRGYDMVNGTFHADHAGKGDWKVDRLGSGRTENSSQFAVGVRSAGPDRKWDTEDDISTWPEEVE